MSFVKRFFQEDIPATFSAGKWRVQLVQLKTRLNQLEKQKNTIFNDLGTKTWESRVKDDRYGQIYDKLEELDASRAEAQQEIDAIQANINRESDQLNSTTADFDARLKDTQQQRQEAVQKLTQMQTTQRNIEQRISQLQTKISQGTTNIQSMQSQIGQLQTSDQADKDEKIASLQSTIESMQAQINDAAPQVEVAKLELEANRAEQVPIISEVEGYDQLIKMLQEQKRAVVTSVQEKQKSLQQSLIKANEKKSGILKEMTVMMPDLGKQVFQHRPAAEALSEIYKKLDSVQDEIKGVNDEINLTQARLASISRGSLAKVTIAGGTLLSLVVCIILFTSVAVPRINQMLKPDPKRDIRVVQKWTLENCSVYGSSSGNFLDISIWENRRNDATASAKIDVKLLGANEIVLDSSSSELEIVPGGLAVSMVNMNSSGSRVQEVIRSVSSVNFADSFLTDPIDIEVNSFFEKTRNTNNVTLGLEVTNNSDFRLMPVDAAFALVTDKENNVIDILTSSFYSPISIDSMSKIEFVSLNSYGALSCLKSDYSEEAVTFWYFVPLKFATGSEEQYTVSGEVDYSP